MEEINISIEDFNEAIADEGGALGAEPSMAVEDGEQMGVRAALEVGADNEAVLVLVVRLVRVEARDGEGGVEERETGGGDSGRGCGTAGEDVAEWRTGNGGGAAAAAVELAEDDAHGGNDGDGG